MDSSITPVLPIGGDGGGFGMGGWGGIIGLLAVLGLANGGFGFGNNQNAGMDAVAAAIASSRNNGYQPQYATQQDVQFTSQFGQILDGNRDLSNLITSGTAQTIAASTANAANAITAIKDGNASLIREFGNVETALTALGGKQQECCCEILRAVDGVNYNGAINTAAINANTTAAVQKVLDAISANRMADMQARINQLELAQAMSGVIRFPSSYTYGAGPFPPLSVAA